MQHGHALLLEALKKRRSGWLDKPGIRMLEIGTTREPLPTQDSTRILSEFCRDHGWQFTTCDMDPANSAAARELFASMGVDFTAVTAKGEDYVADPAHAVEIVYLDAYDFDHGEHSEARQQRYEEHLGSRIDQHACEVMHLETMQGLTRTAPPRCLVVIDDTWQDSEGRWLGKGPLAVPWAVEHGWRLTMSGNGFRAVVLEKPKDGGGGSGGPSMLARLRRRAAGTTGRGRGGAAGTTSRHRPAPATRPDDAAEATASEWTREALFGARFTPRSVQDVVRPSGPVTWEVDNAYDGQDRDDLLATLATHRKWRYHHGIDELQRSPELFRSFAARVDALMDMVDRALADTGISVEGSSVVDLGAAEGYVANHLAAAGATVDMVELNRQNIDRIRLVQAITGRTQGRIGCLDLDAVDWSGALGRRYDISLALGVVYHMENPMLFARNLLEVTGRVAVVETDAPALPPSDRLRGRGALHVERSQVTLDRDDVRYVSELRPDARALAELLLNAGFSAVRVVPAEQDSVRYYQHPERAVLVAER